jgi:hypothetical protein
LEYIAIDRRARLVGRVALQRRGGLAKLQVQTDAPSLSVLDVGRIFDYESGLVEAERVAQDVVRAQPVDAADGVIEVLAVVGIQ